ncbi:MAG: hypothetical protein MJ062_05735 [Oscillospiraceae bacterium]|nr:hypothetical protein [Oscillospiraceae bacterium]
MHSTHQNTKPRKPFSRPVVELIQFENEEIVTSSPVPPDEETDMDPIDPYNT